MTLFESSFPIQHHKACASRMINALNENQICYSCIQPCFFAHECNPHDTNVTQHVPHVRHKIASTNLLHCIQEAHKLHTISLQASNPVSFNTSFFLQAEGQDVSNTGDLSPIRQQAGKHHSSDANKTTCSSDSVIWATHETYYLLYANNMASITQVMITRLHVAQRVFHTRFAKTIRIPRHHRIVLRATAAQRTTTRFILQPVFRRSVGRSRDRTRRLTIKVKKAQTAYGSSMLQFRLL